MPTSLKLIFAGTPDFAATHLERLIAGPHEVVTVLTQPDRRAGRGKQLQASPVKNMALSANLPVWQPDSLKSDEAESVLRNAAADLMIVVAYGLILPAAILTIPKLGCVNVHASLLPRWRGAAPVQRAIESGDRETGVSIMAMEPGLDTGPVLSTHSMTICDHHTGGMLLGELAALGASALEKDLRDIESLLLSAAPQQHELANYAHKIDKAECAIDWNEDAEALWRRIRAFNPAPGCYTLLGEDRLKILSAHIETGPRSGAPGDILSADDRGLRVRCGEGILVITEGQLPGAKALPIATLINGHRDRLRPGVQLKPPGTA
ncbi:methionyl-tRNA formyltransferase [Luminiphilus sp.]|nr:methionyl-tRNA formyltransferase [Luminiphilus sp.]MDA9711348.1 methionyl-tRNA formyltransferase [Luminiphilus sp.]